MEPTMTDELVRQLFERETDHILAGIGRRVPSKEAEAVAAGALTGGMYPLTVHGMVIEGLREAAKKRVEIEKTVWQRQTKKPNRADANICKDAIAKSIDQVAPKFFSFIEQACRTAQQPQLVSIQREMFDAEKARLVLDAYRDVNIWVGFSEIDAERPAISPVNVTYNLQNYGILQAGPHSRAIVLAGGVSDNRGVIQALSEVRSEIAELKELQLEQKTELVGALDTAIAEVQKEKPNPLTIGGIISAVGSAMSILANAPKAYETLRTAAKYYGVELPPTGLP